MLRIALFVSAFFIFSCGNSQKTEVVSTNDTTQVPNAQSVRIPDNGDYIKRYKNGVIEIQGQMKDGKREGIWKSFYQNGAAWSETTFSAGVKNGATASFYENGQKRYAGFFTNDKESGKWSFWDEQGNLAREMDYNVVDVK